MIRQLTDTLRPRTGYQTTMYLLGSLLMLSAVLHAGVFLVDGGSWWGNVSWRKPITFGFSLGVMVLSLGWIQGLLPLHRVLGWLTTVLVGGFSVIEAGLITTQRWRAVPSHFNQATGFDAAVWYSMAAAIGIVTVGIVIVLVWVALRLRGAPSTMIAVVVGLVLLLISSGIGGDLVARGNALTSETGAPPSALLIGLAGSGKLAHAAGIHGLQALGMLEILLAVSSITEQRRTRLMTMAAVGYTSSAVLIGLQAYGGGSMLELSVPMITGLAIAILLVGFVYLSAVRAGMRSAMGT